MRREWKRRGFFVRVHLKMWVTPAIVIDLERANDAGFAIGFGPISIGWEVSP